MMPTIQKDVATEASAEDAGKVETESLDAAVGSESESGEVKASHGEAATDPKIAELETALAAMKDKADEAELTLADITAMLVAADLLGDADVKLAIRIVLNDRSAHLARIVELEGQLGASASPVPVETKKGKLLEIHRKAKRADFDAATVIAFTDGDGCTIKDLPALSFLGEQFGAENGNRHLNAVIDFPVAIPEVVVAAVWLVSDDGKPVARYDLIQPVLVDGGRSQRFNPGTINFTFDPSPAPAAA